MGRWYDEHITVKRDDFANSPELCKLSLIEKSTILKKMKRKKPYRQDIHSYITDGFYLVGLGDLKLDSDMIKSRTNSEEPDLPFLTKASWAGEKRMGIILKLKRERHWNTTCHACVFQSNWTPVSVNWTPGAERRFF